MTDFSHNHNSDLLPIYGVTDLYALYELYSKNMMSNKADFSFVLATPDGVYDLRITDAGQFMDFISDKGLTLYKSRDNAYTNWGRVHRVNNTITIVNCNN